MLPKHQIRIRSELDRKMFLQQATAAVNIGDFEEVEKVYLAILRYDADAIDQLQNKITSMKLEAAEFKHTLGELNRSQGCWLPATRYFKEAAELVPDGNEVVKSCYLQKVVDVSNEQSAWLDSLRHQ